MTTWTPVLLLLNIAAAGAPTPSALTFADAVRVANESNADLRAADATFRAAGAQEGIARAGYLPTINGTLSYSKSGGSQAAPGAVDQSGTFTATLSANQNIFAGLQTIGQRTQAAANVRAAEATRATTRARVGYDLVVAFAGVVFATESVKLNEDIINRRQENLRLVTLRYQSGRENQGSVLLSQAYLDQARYDHLQSRNVRRVAGAQLARALGLDDHSSVAVTGDVPGTAPDAEPPAFDDLARTIPDYALARAQAEAADAGVTVARSTFLPQVALTAASNDYGTKFFPNQRDRWSMGASLTLPLFNGGRDFYALRAAADVRVAAESTRVNASRQAVAKLEQTWATFIEGAAKVKVDDGFRRAAGLRAEIARKKYNNGLQTFDDWDVIENDLITRQKAYLQSKRDRATAEAAYAQALGKGVL